LHGGGGGRPCHEGLDATQIEDALQKLESSCLDAMRRAAIDQSNITTVRTVSMRYRRQTNDLSVELPQGSVLSDAFVRLINEFERKYESVYGAGSGFSQAGIEITNLRVEAVGNTQRPALRRPSVTRQPVVRTRTLFEPTLNRWVDASVYQWDGLPTDFRIAGPAVIEHPETALYLAAGQAAHLDRAGNISIDLRGDR
jgi:N-methylhydantoinase A